MKQLTLYRRLNEEFESIEHILKLLSEPVINKLKEQGIITEEGKVNPAKVKGVVNKSHNVFDEAIKYTDSLEEEKALCQLFTQCVFNNKLDLIDEGQNVFNKNLKELGFNRFDNPYLDFVKVYNGKKLSNEDWIILNNIYANSDVDSQTLRGTGVDGKDHIIFNPSLWNQASRDDKLYLIDLWEDLGDPNFVDKLHLENIKDKQLKNLIVNEEKIDVIRKNLLYSTGKTLRSINSIKRHMLEVQSGLRDSNQLQARELNKTKDNVVRTFKNQNKAGQNELAQALNDSDVLGDYKLVEK